MTDAIVWFLAGIWSGIAGPVYVIAHLPQVLDFSDKENLLRVVYYGASVELFFFFFNIVVAVFVVGLFRSGFLWAVTRGLETFANGTGRLFAWAGLIMVLQQVMVIFLQSIFRVSEISLGPFGLDFSQTVGWWSDSLKLYNAMVVALCCAWTFTQGGHVRVDLFYSGARFRTKKVVDMFGALFFMMPMMLIIWFYSWFFLWRHLINPPVNASDTLERTLLKARAFRWNVETTGFSPSGFNGYFLFKVLIVAFALMMLIQAVAVFYRSFLEWREGPESEGRFQDKDSLGGEPAETRSGAQ